MSDCLIPDQVSVALTDLADSRFQLIFPLLLETFLLAVLTVSVVASIYVLSSKGLRSRPRLPMLTLTLTMYTMSAAVWAIDVESAWNELNVVIPLDLAGGDDTASGDDAGIYLSLTENIFVAVIFVMSDSVVLWRACVIWGMHKGMCIFSVVLILVQICSWVVYEIGIVVSNSVSATPASFRVLGSLSGITDLSALGCSLSLAANVWATAMIAYKTWKHRREVRRYLSNRTRKSAVETVFLLLVESGALYATVWIVFTVLEVKSSIAAGASSAVTNAEYVWVSGMNQVPGIYLTLVIIIVALKQSHLEHTLSNVRTGGEISVPFSVRIPQTTVHTDDIEQQGVMHVSVPDTQIVSGPDTIVIVPLKGFHDVLTDNEVLFDSLQDILTVNDWSTKAPRQPSGRSHARQRPTRPSTALL
ncbi:hypothetical protein OF83DRAFT_1179517 [Amylostereum chailletii]|nr:hypothetical protein OF83DRAFT_1179517 [Amylostereum chailletii]